MTNFAANKNSLRAIGVKIRTNRSIIVMAVFAMVLQLVFPVMVGASPGHDQQPQISVDTINGQNPPFNFSCPDNPLFSPVNLSGSGAGSAPPGKVEQYGVQVDWGDGVIQNSQDNPSDVSATFTPPSGNHVNFSYVFSAGAHSYSSGGTFTINVKLFHTQGSGNDNQIAATVSITVCIVVTPSHDLNVTKSGTGTGTVTSDVGSINCGSTCIDTYIEDTVVTLTATPSSNSDFTGWSGGGCSGTGTCVVTMDSDKTVDAEFTLKTYPLDVTINGTGSGTVTSDVAGISCPSDCDETYDHGTVVTLTATEDSGSTFAGWGGDCSGTGSCVVTMDQARSVTATFNEIPPPDNFILTVIITGDGSGAVESDIAGIDCPSDCVEVYVDGTDVELIATPDSNSTFTGWSGDCSGTGTCSLTMDEDKTVTANFDAIKHDLNVTLDGNGSGVVTSDPTGIDCGSDCSETYNQGTDVELTATPDASSTFTGWSGDCSGTGTCIVTIDADKNVTATFTLKSYPLDVTINGTGSGSVTSDVGSINCPGTCSDTYDHGTVVTLIATEDSGSTFAGWGGDCSGTGSCVVTMDQARSVTATFNLTPPDTFTLTVTTSGDGEGIVTGTGINCDSNPVGEENDCTETYASGTEVTLTADPDDGSNFDNSWSGACTGNNPTCQITMNGNQSVNAHFSLNPSSPPPPSGGGGGGGGGPFNPGASTPSTPSAPAPAVAGIATSAPPPAPAPQVLGAATELPRTGMSLAFLYLLIPAVLIPVFRHSVPAKRKRVK